jgi:hypothetical protein
MVFSSFFRRWREKRDAGIVAIVKPQPEPPHEKSPWYPTPNVRDEALCDRYWQQWREKRRTEIVAAVNTQPERPHEKSDPWHPPRDVHDHAAWDRYWQHRKGDRFDYCPAIDLRPRSEEELLIQCLIKRGAKTVLCAGNGVSQEPRALAAAGFDVTAMDLSPLAVHLAETCQFSSEELDSFCAKEQRTPDGTVRFVIGDVLDRSVCPAPFDAIIERRMLQLFPEREQGVALDALASRLTADGLLLSHRHNQLPVWPSIVELFHDRGWSFWTPDASSLKVPDRDGRAVWLIMSTG